MNPDIKHLLLKAYKSFKNGDYERSVRFIRQADLLNDADIIYRCIRTPSG